MSIPLSHFNALVTKKFLEGVKVNSLPRSLSAWIAGTEPRPAQHVRLSGTQRKPKYSGSKYTHIIFGLLVGTAQIGAVVVRMWAEGFSRLQPPDDDDVGQLPPSTAARSAPPTLWTDFTNRNRNYE